jgi:rhodanese-related sulfurtransferase
MMEIKMPDAPRAKDFFLDKITYTTGPVEVDTLLSEGEQGVVIVDVRARKDYDQAHIPGAISIPKEEWAHPHGLARDKTNILYCYSHVCHLAAKAAVEFSSQGYPVMEMDGGFKAWREHDLKVEDTRKPSAESGLDAVPAGLPN